MSKEKEKASLAKLCFNFRFQTADIANSFSSPLLSLQEYIS